jgi:hypothetical protein
MKTLKYLGLGGFLLFICFGWGYAARPFQFAIHFTPGFPQSEFRENIGSTAWGGDLSFSYRLPKSSFSIGTSLGYLVYGHHSRHEPLSHTLPDVIVDVSTTNAILLWHVFLRFQPQQGRVRPYAEVLAGLHHLTTDTSIDDHHGWGDEDSISSNNYSDTAMSFGVGAGVMFPVLQIIRRGSDTSLFSLDLDIGARYLKGGVAEYLKKDSIVREEGAVSYWVYESSTDLFIFQIGLSFVF